MNIIITFSKHINNTRLVSSYDLIGGIKLNKKLNKNVVNSKFIKKYTNITYHRTTKHKILQLQQEEFKLAFSLFLDFYLSANLVPPTAGARRARTANDSLIPSDWQILLTRKNGKPKMKIGPLPKRFSKRKEILQRVQPFLLLPSVQVYHHATIIIYLVFTFLLPHSGS